MLRLLLTFSLSAILSIGLPAMAEPVTDQAAMQTQLLWIDVRTPEEFAQGHLPGALNIPHEQMAARIGAVATTDVPIALYCRSGHRSAIAEKTLRALGYTQVSNQGAYRDLRHR